METCAGALSSPPTLLLSIELETNVHTKVRAMAEKGPYWEPVQHSVINVKSLVGAFKPGEGPLYDCKIFANLRIAFVSSTSVVSTRGTLASFQNVLECRLEQTVAHLIPGVESTVTK